MSDIVNLRRARKEKSRAAKDKQAEENRIRFGQPKKDRAAAKARTSLEEKILESHRLGPDEPPEE